MPSILMIPIKTTDIDNNVVYMSTHLFYHLQMDTNREIALSLGKKIINIKIIFTEVNPNEIYVPEYLYTSFCLPIEQYTLQVKYSKVLGIIFLGPIIGLVTNFNSSGSIEPHFGSIHNFCEELHHGLSANGGLFYVFSHTDFPEKGFYYKEGNWHAAKLPLPDVIYNRIHSRRLEYAPEFLHFRKSLSQLSIPLFNDRFLSKWEVHEKLSHENHMQTSIPETILFSRENLNAFAKKYDHVYIKPVHGSQGRNIFKLEKEENLFRLKSSKKINLEKNELTIDEIYQLLIPLLNNRIYIIQQGIHLLTFDSRGLDFRVLCHKNDENNWNITSIVARISAENEFVSNIARGGEIMSPLKAMTNIMTLPEAKKALSSMEELAIEIASAIDLQSTGITGELGIDIGVDQNGKPWLIEVNSKPSKNFEDGQMKIRPSAKAIILFCTKLALQYFKEKEEKM